jgi:uncharacterized damage-inducible protein DinB
MKENMTTLSTGTENSSAALKDYFIELAEFSRWADDRVMSWLSQITEETWNQEAVSSFGSIRDTAVHIVSAQNIWLDFWTKAQQPTYLSSEFTGSRAELIDIWTRTSTALNDFIKRYPAADYSTAIQVRKPNGEMNTMEFRKTFPHMINHSTYHRGQLVTLLRQAGFLNLSNTDLFTFYLT